MTHIPKLVEEKIDFYLFRGRLNRVNREYQSLHNDFFGHLDEMEDRNNNIVFLKDDNLRLYNWRSGPPFHQKIGYVIFGPKKLNSFSIISYIKELLIDTTPVKKVNHHVGFLPNNYWISSGLQHPRAYK